jgi:hypothetical protein
MTGQDQRRGVPSYIRGRACPGKFGRSDIHHDLLTHQRVQNIRVASGNRRIDGFISLHGSISKVKFLATLFLWR